MKVSALPVLPPHCLLLPKQTGARPRLPLLPQPWTPAPPPRPRPLAAARTPAPPPRRSPVVADRPDPAAASLHVSARAQAADRAWRDGSIQKCVCCGCPASELTRELARRALRIQQLQRLPSLRSMWRLDGWPWCGRAMQRRPAVARRQPPTHAARVRSVRAQPASRLPSGSPTRRASCPRLGTGADRTRGGTQGTGGDSAGTGLCHMPTTVVT